MLAIDFGARSIKAVKLNRSGGGYYLDNYGMILTPPGSILHGEIKDIDAVSQALNKLIHKNSLYDKGNIIAITGQKVIVREITTPLMNEKELSEGIQWEAPKYVPYDLKESLLDVKIIEELEEKEGTKMMKVLLVAAPKSLVDQQIAVLKNVRIQPRVVDIVANAQIRAFESYLAPATGDEDGTMIDIILSMGASTTEITLLEGDRLKFTRTILKGGGDITELIVKKLALPFQEAEALKRSIGLSLPEEKSVSQNNVIKEDESVAEEGLAEIPLEQAGEEKVSPSINIQGEEASTPSEEEIADLVQTGVNEIFNEIRKSLNYFKTQYQKVNYQRIILCGGMTQLPQIGQMLKKQFGITVVIANPLKDIAINERNINIENLDKYKSALATVIGLAKRER